MTTEAILKFIIEGLFVLLAGYAIYKEKTLIKFERKVAKVVKAFFKAAYYSIIEKKKRKPMNVVNIHSVSQKELTEEYEKMLAKLNKASKLDDVLVAWHKNRWIL